MYSDIFLIPHFSGPRPPAALELVQAVDVLWPDGVSLGVGPEVRGGGIRVSSSRRSQIRSRLEEDGSAVQR